jgi:hypothetical protein
MGPTSDNTEALPKTVNFADTSNLTTLHDPHDLRHEESSSDTATNSSDEFWDGAAKEDGVLKPSEEIRARRGRRLYLFLMRLYRPIRVLLVAVLGAGVLITPFLVFRYSFPSSVARPHVDAWSIWLTVSWACGAAISILIDLSPRIILSLILNVFGKPPESLTTELEVCCLNLPQGSFGFY